MSREMRKIRTNIQAQGIFIGTALLIALLALAAPALAADWPVTTSSDITSIISGAAGGDTITLAPGTYPWHDITITGKSLTFRADTANGHGPADTIMDAQSAGRIFNVTDGSSLTIDNLTLQNGRAADGALGGLFADGADGENGGAISSAGPVIITSSTITGCTAGSGGYGGYGGFLANPADPGICGGAGSGGNGGAVYSTGTVTVTSSTISGCSAGSSGTGGPGVPSGSGGIAGTGGAVYGAGTIHFCRLVNNGAGTVVYGSSSLDATDNWWGSDDNPSGQLGGGATASPWLVLGATASPASVATTGTSAIRANLTYHTDGTTRSAASGAVPDGTPVTFTAAGGSVSPVHAATDSGIASTTFTPSGTGTATIMATVDQQSVSVPVTVTATVMSTNVTTIAVDPVSASTVYAGIDNQGIYTSTNGGTLWLPATTQPSNKHIRALAINSSHPNTLYAGTYGGGVYRSTDSGVTWNACSTSGLTNPYVLSLVRNMSGAIYAGTDDGVFASSDECASWTALNGGLP